VSPSAHRGGVSFRERARNHLLGHHESNSVLSCAEIYDPATGNVVLLANTMRLPRGQHQATLLPDGLVLIAGGQVDNLSGDGSNTAELYDPAKQSFTALNSTMTSLRRAHGATLLASIST
jgi:hypothetical protein